MHRTPDHLQLHPHSQLLCGQLPLPAFAFDHQVLVPWNNDVKVRFTYVAERAMRHAAPEDGPLI